MTGNLADLFEAVVDRLGDAVALDTLDGPVGYDELDAEANRFAAWLTSVGVAQGDIVAIAVGNRREHVVSLLGSFKLRAVPINVNCNYTESELTDLLVDSGAKVLVSEVTIPLPGELAGVIVHLPVGSTFTETIAAFPTARVGVTRRDDDRYILYTGGSTGRPKGVVWRHRDLVDAVLGSVGPETPTGRVLPACPFTHGTAQWTLLSALVNGSTVVLAQPCGLDPVSLWSRVEQAEASRIVIVGDAFARPMLDALDAEPNRWNLSRLVAITSGGARWSEATRLGLLAHLPQVAMVNSFGASETGGQGSQVTFAGQGAEAITGLVRFDGDGTSTVLDENGRPLTPGSGQVGRLARSGPIPQGYLGDPDTSPQVFREFHGVRYALPGDLAMIDIDGKIVVLGRDRNVINTGGEKVYAEEVEGRLVRHEAVADAVVAGIADDRWGQSINALVRLHPGHDTSGDDLRRHCAQTLARFKVPRHILVVDDVRHQPSGKLDRKWAADTIARTLEAERRSRNP